MDIEKIQKELILSGRDPRYPSRAYGFILRSLDYCHAKSGERRHLSGLELCEGVIEFAASQFGPAAADTLSDLNIHTTDDIGTIVYNLIDINVASKKPDDSLDEFHNLFNIAERLKSITKVPDLDKKTIKSLKGS